MPVFKNSPEGLFGFVNVPINAMLLVLVGLCTSVMWGGIFNLAVEGLGKYTERASGIFMALVCGGGILPLLQNAIVDMQGGIGYCGKASDSARNQSIGRRNFGGYFWSMFFD